MPSRQQKSAKKSSERHLMFGSNHILITLKWNHGHCPTRENVCRWFLNRCKQLLRPTKLTNRVFLGTCSKWNLKFQNWSKPLCLGVSNLLKKDIYGQKQKKWTSSMNSAYSIVLVPSFSLNWQFWFFFIRFAQKGFFSSKTETVNTTYFLHNSAYSN